MRIIGVASEKGGVGKTTIATALASIAAHRGIATLVVDLDPQGNAGYALNASLAGPAAAGLITKAGQAPAEVAPRLSVFVGGPALKDADVQNAHPDDLLVALRPYAESFGAIIIDTPPGDPRLVQMALCAATAVVVPIEAHPFAVQGARRVIEQARRMPERGRQTPDLVIALSAINLSRRDDRDLDALLAATYPDLPRVAIPQDTAVSGASRDRLDLMTSAPRAKGTLALQQLADRLHLTAKGAGRG